MSVPRVVDGIEKARKIRVRDGEYNCGSIYSKMPCPKCKTRKLVMWSSTDRKRGNFWKCGCGWNSYEDRP